MRKEIRKCHLADNNVISCQMVTCGGLNQINGGWCQYQPKKILGSHITEQNSFQFLSPLKSKKKTRCPGPELPNNPHKKIYFKIILNVYESFHFIYNESR